MNARVPCGRCRRRRVRSPRPRRPSRPPSSSCAGRSTSMPRPVRCSPRRRTSVFGWPRSRRICSDSRRGSRRRRRSSRAVLASSRRPRWRSRRPPPLGATPRTSAGASPRRRPRTVPRWRRSGDRSPRTTASDRGWRSRWVRFGSVAPPVRPNARASRPTSSASTPRPPRSPIAAPCSNGSATGSRTRWPNSRRGSAGSSFGATCCGRASTTSSGRPALGSLRSTPVAASGSSAS